MNLIDLIQSDKEQAQSAISDMLQTKVFDYLDNYVLESESTEELDEAVVPGSVKKDDKGHVLSFKTVPDKKSAVVPGSVKKDNKGNILSFKTEDFEAMNQDEFDAVVENFEQLDELSKATLGSYIKKANDRRGVNSISDHESEVRGKGVMTAAEKLTGGKAAGLQGLAMDARYAKSTGNKDAAGFKKTFDKRVDAIVKK